jgi:TonB family protein
MILVALALVAAQAPTAFGEQGHAVVECTVTPIGALHDCKAVSESPVHANVGAFAVKLTKGFLIDPHDARIKNGKVRIPMQFKMPKPK